MNSKIYQLLKDKEKEILDIAKKHGALNLRVFGSVVRKEADEKSDVDFLIDLGEKRSPWFPAGLILDLQGLLNRKVDIVTPNALKPKYRSQILKEAIPLCEMIDKD